MQRTISKIQIGDYVLSWNWETGAIGFYPVTAKLEHEDETIVHLVIDDEGIVTTPEHPFYSEEQGWVKAGDLKEGMHIREADGKDGVVKSVVAENSPERMYNLTVKEVHTFFVGEGEWLVHNMCPGSLPRIKNVEITPEKIRYLFTDPEKAAGFQRMGYSPQEMYNILDRIGGSVSNENFIGTNIYGYKYNYLEVMQGPSGAVGRLTTGWQVDYGSNTLRFIIAWFEVFR